MNHGNPLTKLAYSIAEFCQLVGLGRTGAFKEIRLQRLKAIKVGRRTLIPAAEVMAWLERMGATPAERATN